LFPAEEKFNMVEQVRRAGFSGYLNIAGGCSRKSLAERRRFFEISRGPIIEIDAVLNLCIELNSGTKENIQKLGELMQRTFSMLTKMLG